jgi:hypothetical protein
VPAAPTPRREFPGAEAGWPAPESSLATAGRLKEKGNWRVGSRRGCYRGRRGVGRLFYGIFKPRGGMAAGVNLLKLFDADFGVDGRGVEFFVPKQLLDEPDVRPVLQHVRGAGVPQDVAAATVLQPGPDQPRRHHARHHVGIERAAVAG